ncbi:capsular polysaccharide synthesis protein [Sulfurimonas sp. HSL1-2]|uniref:capsular polysaccharide synthesis protein n=1 Tax=Thiomicrolovo zhangzhouensis TaxID=3131933 RepID=UPI0031F7B598
MDNQFTIPQTIWMYWEQGFENAPLVVKKCVESWKRLNPEWDIRLLDETSLTEYVQLDLPEEKISSLLLAHKSDLIRLKLLDAYGGVWADATTYCMKPLDSWLNGVSGTGFFAFDRPGPGRLLSNWFLAAEKHNRIISKWHRLLHEFWDRNTFPKPGRYRQKLVKRVGLHLNGDCQRTKYWFLPLFTKVFKIYPYAVMHFLFERLISNDAESRIIWQKTKKISADGPHALQFAGLLTPLSEEHKKLVDESDAPMFKLTYKGFEAGKYPSSLLWYLLEGRDLEQREQAKK